MTPPKTFDALLRTYFPLFVERVFNELNPGSSFVRSWHVDAMAYALDQVRTGADKRLIINVSPRALKSVTASIAWTAFLLGHNPSARLICVSYSQPLAAFLSRACRRVMAAGWYQRLFPATVIAKDTEDLIETTQGGYRLATSVGGALTGFGADTIILDDPMKADEANSEAARDKLNGWFADVLYSRLNDKTTGAIVLVTQRLHQGDLSGLLLAQGGWDHLCLPAMAVEAQDIPLGYGRVHHREPGDLLQPEREPLSVLQQIRSTQGSATFEAQYQQNPLPATGNMLKAEWLVRYPHPPARSDGRLVLSWDTAAKGDPGCDFSVCTVWQDCNGRHYLLDVIRERLDFPALRRKALELYRHWRPEAVLIEDAGSGSSLIQEFKHEGVYPIPCRPEKDKVSRFAAVTPMFEARHVFLPEDAVWLPDYSRELLGFPTTSHDDQVDSTSQYLIWARGRGPDRFDVDWGWDDGGPNLDAIAERLCRWR